MAHLSNFNINCRVSPRYAATFDLRAKGVDWVLRVSPHYYNTVEEIDFLIAKLAELP